MITSAQEYESQLWQIQNENIPETALLLPKTEKIYNIDLNARMIDAPDVLSVEHDHRAEVIYFMCDRYFDFQDLSNTVCVIQYVNAIGEVGVYAVPFYDIKTYAESDKMLIPWAIGGRATAKPGNIKFSIRFYMIRETDDLDVSYISYSLNTQVASSKILYGMDSLYKDKTVNVEELDYLSTIRDDIYNRINAIEQLTWIDA